jgi:hypothetical protein
MVIVETSMFTRRVLQLLAEEEYRKLQAALVNRPQAGAIIRGSGGLRKVRWAGRAEANAAACGLSTTGQLNKRNCSCFSSSPRMSVMTYRQINLRF